MLDPRLAERIANVIEDWKTQTALGLEVISGYRTEVEQDTLRRQGRPTAPPGVSTHTSCPATGVDLRISALGVTKLMKARLGTIALMNGLRWGGGGEDDPETGIPVDWNHFDLGPRVS